MERNLLKQFQKYAHKDVVEKDTDWHWLSVAQHHGLPTRLLDWTYSPLVALHFATFDLDAHAGKDAAVWKVNYSQVHDLLQKGEQLVWTSLEHEFFPSMLWQRQSKA
jgi:FRG domain-containing protein